MRFNSYWSLTGTSPSNLLFYIWLKSQQLPDPHSGNTKIRTSVIGYLVKMAKHLSGPLTPQLKMEALKDKAQNWKPVLHHGRLPGEILAKKHRGFVHYTTPEARYMCHASSYMLWGWKNKPCTGTPDLLVAAGIHLTGAMELLKLGPPDLNGHLSFGKARKNVHNSCHVTLLWFLPWLTKFP